MAWILDNVPLWVWVVLVIGTLAATYPLWSAIFLLLPKPVKILLGAVAAGLAAYFAGRYRGAQNEKQRQKDADAQAVDTRNKTNAEVTNLDPVARDKSFNRWLRD